MEEEASAKNNHLSVEKNYSLSCSSQYPQNFIAYRHEIWNHVYFTEYRSAKNKFCGNKLPGFVAEIVKTKYSSSTIRHTF
ncbi:UNVERIFIED_CONTAM: hypothetical protein NCL1_44000 [Trichonephila clavipes]